MTKPQRSLIDHFHRPKDISAYKKKKQTLRQKSKDKQGLPWWCSG